MPGIKVIPGIINRLRAAINFDTYPGLNITSSYITADGIRIGLEGNATDLLPAMMSLVSSPAPYLACTVTAPIIRSVLLANEYKKAIETNTLLGLMHIIPDAEQIDAFVVNNTALETVREMSFAGREPAMVITLRGYYVTNQNFYTGG